MRSTKKKVLRSSLAAGAGLLVVFGAVTSCASPERAQQPETQSAPVKVALEASWSTGYTTLAEMTSDVDAVVTATVTPKAKTFIRDGLPFTDTVVSVQKWLKGKTADAPAEITVRQTGGQMNGSLYEVRDDPLLASGAQAVLFLKISPTGIYYITGGPTGRLTL